jgi:hypothetical protein
MTAHDSVAKINLVLNFFHKSFLVFIGTSFQLEIVMSGLSLIRKPMAFRYLAATYEVCTASPFGLTSVTEYVQSGHLFMPHSPRFRFLSLAVVSVASGVESDASSSVWFCN